MTGPGGRSISSTLGGRVEAAAARGGAVTFASDPGSPRVSWAQLHDDARAVAGELVRRGIEQGDRVAFLGPTSRPLVTALQAVWLAGATSVMVPLPYRMGAVADFVAQTRRRILDSGVAAVVADPALAPFVEAADGDPPFVLLPDLAAGAERAGTHRFDPPPVDPASTAVLQYTSGATTDPAGVVLPHATILANLDAVATAASLDPAADVFVSWLPLYHDMGLMGLLTLPMVTGTDLVLATPQDFLAAPGRWAEWIAAFRGTIGAGPNFAYALLARALRGMHDLDLSPWRIALSGAEMVDAGTTADFVAAGERHRLDPGAVLPAYGMAETVIGATLPPPGRGLVVDRVDLQSLSTSRLAEPVPEGSGAGARTLARLGPPVAGLELRVCDPERGDGLGERQVGEVELRGPSLMAGYEGRPERASTAFRDGWFRTGDLGYQVDGELVLCGRLADVIATGGGDLYPEVVERAAAGVTGVRPGNVAAFAADGPGSALVVVAEVRGGDPIAIRREVAERVGAATNAVPGEVVLVAPGALPKTTSGKLQRARCRQQYLAQELQPA